MVPQTVEVRIIVTSVTRQFMPQGPHAVKHTQFTPCRVQLLPTNFLHTASFTQLA